MMNNSINNSRYVTTSKGLFAACILSAAGALVFNAFPLFLSTIADHWKLSDEQLGLLGTSFLSGFAITSLAANYWMVRFKWKITGFLSYLLIGVGIVGFSKISNNFIVFGSMALFGVGSGTIFTIAIGVLSRAINVDRAYGLKTSAEMLVASILLYVMTSIVIARFGFQGFVYGSLIIYCASAVSVLLLPSNFMKREKVSTDNEKGKLTRGNNPAGWLSAIALFIQIAAFAGLWGFMERIGVNNGLSPNTIGKILSLSVVFGLGGALLASVLGNRYGQAKPLSIALIITFFTVLLLAGTKGAITFAIAACAINALLQICVIYLMALVTIADQTGNFTLMIAFILSSSGAVGPGCCGISKNRR